MTALIFLSCNSPKENTQDDVLVTIGNDRFFGEDLLEYIPKNASPEDSLKISNKVIDEWVKETLFKQVAKKQSYDQKIKEMVKSYEASLLVYNYESKLIQEKLDSTITESDIDLIYAENKGNFLLNSKAYLIFTAIVGSKYNKEFEQLWDKNKWEKVEAFCDSLNLEAQILDSIWVKKDKKIDIPEKIRQNTKLERGFNLKKKINDDYYYLQVMKIKEIGDLAPKNILVEDLKKLILHRRKKDIIEKEKTLLYKDAISKKSVVHYSDKF